MKAYFTSFMAAVVLVFCCTNAVQATDETPYNIHVVVPQSGPLALIGAKTVEGLNVEEAFINAHGGLRGRAVRFIFHDDAGNPQLAVQLVSQLKEQGVQLIIGPETAATCAASFPLLETAGPVSWCLAGGVEPKPHTFTFGYGPSIPDIEPVVLRYFYRGGARNFALITSTDATGQLFDTGFTDVFTKAALPGAKIVAREHFGTTDLSVDAQMIRIKAAKPDVILTFTNGTPFGAVLHAISNAGIDVPVYGSGANFSIQQIEQYSEFLPKELILNGANGIVPDPSAPPAVKRRQLEFFNAMKAAGVHDIEYGDSLPWDIAMLNVDALRALGAQATAAQLHAYFERLSSWVGIQGVYNFTTADQRGLEEAGVALYRWNAARRNFDLIPSAAKKP